jgi:uncharacterized damage-inducible protein DinB
MVRLESFLTSWKSVRADTAQAVEDLPAGNLDFKPQDDMLTFRQIAEHIVYAGRGLTGIIMDGEQDLTTPDFREKLKKYYRELPADAGATDIAAELRRSLEEDCAALSGKDNEFLAQIITRFDGMKVTRMEMLQFVKEHELTHRAQLFMYLRLNGVIPPTTRRRLAQKK